MNRYKKISLTMYILGGVLFAIAVFRIIVVNIIENRLDEQAKRLRSQGIHVYYEDVSVGWLEPSVYISGLSAAGMADKDSVFAASVDRACIRRVRINDLLFRKKLVIDRLELDQLSVMTKAGRSLPHGTAPTGKKKKFLNSATISVIEFTDIQWRHYDAEDSLSMITGADQFFMGGFRMDDLNSPKLNYFFETIQSGNLSFKSAKGQHIISIDKIHYNELNEDLIFDNVRVTPLLDKEAFARHFQKQVDRITAYSKEVRFSKITFWDEGRFYVKARQMDFDFTLETYRNKTYPFARKKPIAMPQELLKKAGFLFDIDTLRIKNAFIAYEEMNKKNRDPGRIFFKDLNLQAIHFTNDSTYKYNQLHVTSHFMEHGAVNVDFYMPFDPAEKYWAKGNVSPFELSELNSILKSSALLGMKTGRLDTLNFFFKYDDTLATGYVEFAFSDLKMQAYKPKNTEKISLFRTLAINQLIRINDVKDAYLVGEINYPRNPVRSIISYWWKSLLSGLKAAVIKDGAINPNRKKKGSFDYNSDYDEE